MLLRLLLPFLIITNILIGCSDFLIVANGSVVNGRSMDFSVDLKTTIAVHYAGESTQTTTPDGQKGVSWTSKYSYASILPFGLDKPIDGLNEKGLSFGALWFNESKYMQIKNPDKALDLQEFGNWLLGNFATVDEVKEGLKGIEVWSHVNQNIGEIPAIHFAIHDLQGKSLVVEFIDGKMVVTDNPTSILTNSPYFDWHINNLRNFLHLNPQTVKTLHIGELSLAPPGNGGGLFGLPGDWSSPSRFVKLFFMNQFALKPKNSDEAINLAFHFLNALDIPCGLVQNKGTTADFTQWIVVKDLVNKKIYFRTYNNLMIRVFDLTKEFAKKDAPTVRTAFAAPQVFAN